MATIEERDLFARSILYPVAEQADKLKAEPVSGFLAAKGQFYDGRLMVVGRATNGWETEEWKEGILPSELAQPGVVSRYADSVFRRSNSGDPCPLGWVSYLWGKENEPYNTRRSAFWRVIRGVMIGLGLAFDNQEDWPSYLVWSNLYKVAPTKAGNPREILCRLQLDGCIQLLWLEVETYRPERVLFLTDYQWWARPLLEQIGARLHESPNTRQVRAAGRLEVDPTHSARVVVSTHPMRKPHQQWVNEAVAAFTSLD